MKHLRNIISYAIQITPEENTSFEEYGYLPPNYTVHDFRIYLLKKNKIFK